MIADLKKNYGLSVYNTECDEDTGRWIIELEFDTFDNFIKAKSYMKEKAAQYVKWNFSYDFMIFIPYTSNIPLLKYTTYDLETYNQGINYIFKKYVGRPDKRRAIIQCQKDLIDSGFAENAQL